MSGRFMLIFVVGVLASLGAMHIFESVIPAAIGMIGTMAVALRLEHRDSTRRRLDLLGQSLALTFRHNDSPPRALRTRSASDQAEVLRRALRIRGKHGRSADKTIAGSLALAVGRPGDRARDLMLVSVLLERGLVADAIAILDPQGWGAAEASALADSPHLTVPERCEALQALVKACGARAKGFTAALSARSETPPMLAETARDALAAMDARRGTLALSEGDAGAMTISDD